MSLKYNWMVLNDNYAIFVEVDGLYMYFRYKICVIKDDMVIK